MPDHRLRGASGRGREVREPRRPVSRGAAGPGHGDPGRRGRHGDLPRRPEGNIAKGVEFVVARITEEIAGAGGPAAATAWMNSIPMEAGTPLMEEWAAMIVCRYNGCCSDSSLCVERRNAYRDNALGLYSEYGAAFWDSGSVCEVVPADGRIVDERDPCYVAGGDPQYWRHEATGFEDDLDWTMTTDLDRESNHALWQLDMAAAGRYRVEIHLDGGAFGKSKKARYRVEHGGVTDEVVVDQSVFLGDNTGEGGDAEVSLLYDAIRVTPAGASEPDPGDPGDPGRRARRRLPGVRRRGQWGRVGGARPPDGMVRTAAPASIMMW